MRTLVPGRSKRVPPGPFFAPIVMPCNQGYDAIGPSKTRTKQGFPERSTEIDTVLILLTNDDGIYAPGLAAIERELRRLGEVVVVAPATEQSGVGHSITYLTPLIVKEVFRSEGG